MTKVIKHIKDFLEQIGLKKEQAGGEIGTVYWSDIQKNFSNQVVVVEILPANPIKDISVTDLELISVHEHFAEAIKVYEALQAHFPKRVFHLLHIGEADTHGWADRIANLYRTGGMGALIGVLPFPENFYWRFISVVEAAEICRISYILFQRGYSQNDIKELFPAEDLDVISKHYDTYNSIEIDAIIEGLKDVYRKEFLLSTLTRMKKENFCTEDMLAVWPSERE